MGAFILTLYIMGTAGVSAPLAATTQEHSSLQACDAAKDVIRQAVGQGKIILAVCNPK